MAPNFCVLKTLTVQLEFIVVLFIYVFASIDSDSIGSLKTIYKFHHLPAITSTGCSCQPDSFLTLKKKMFIFDVNKKLLGSRNNKSSII